MHVLAISGGLAQFGRPALVELQQRMRARVWSAAEVRLARVTLDTDTTVHTFMENKWAGV
jgi:hypothetical protein